MSETKKAPEEIAEDIGVYVHELEQEFEWEGQKYKELRFEFSRLKGSDLEAVETEMSIDGMFALSPEYSVAYQLKLAARAANVHCSVIENLPLRDANAIRAKTKAFLTKGEF